MSSLQKHMDHHGHQRPPDWVSSPRGVDVVELVLDDINPRRLVSANRRIHHMVRSEVCAYWRRLAHDRVIADYGCADVGRTWHQRIRVVVTVRFNDRRRHDVGNLYPYVAKPIVDGLVDARLIADDDDSHVVGPDLRRDPEKGPLRITLRIEDLPTNPTGARA